MYKSILETYFTFLQLFYYTVGFLFLIIYGSTFYLFRVKFSKKCTSCLARANLCFFLKLESCSLWTTW